MRLKLDRVLWSRAQHGGNFIDKHFNFKGGIMARINEEQVLKEIKLKVEFTREGGGAYIEKILLLKI